MKNKDEILKYFSASEGLLTTLNAFFKELEGNDLTKKKLIDVTEKHGSIKIKSEISEISEKENTFLLNKIIEKYQNILNIQCFKCGKLSGREDYLCKECWNNFKEENAYKDINREGFSLVETDYYSENISTERKKLKWSEFEKVEIIKHNAFETIIEEIEFKLRNVKTINIPNESPIYVKTEHCSYLTRNFYLLLKSIPKTLLSNNDIADIEKTFKNLEKEFEKWRLEI